MVGQSARYVTSLLGLVLAIGCTADKVDLGNTGVIGASLTDYAGAWEGYAEAFHWSDQTDALRLTLDEQGNGVLSVGDASAPEPTFQADTMDAVLKASSNGLVPGFDYDVAGATVTSRRIRLSASSQELYQDWCGAFEPVADVVNAGMYSCLPNTGWSYEPAEGCRLMDAARTQFDCSKANCQKVCACDANACGAMLSPGDVQLDAALANEGEELTGTLVVVGQRIVVRMQRAQ